MQKLIKTLIQLTVLSVFIAACGGSDSYVPKPHGFPRMEFPAKNYHLFDSAQIPYRFEIPSYSRMDKDTTANYTPGLGWYNLDFPGFNATLHITYYRFDNWKFYDSLVFDTRKLVNKHIQRAEDITETSLTSINPKLKGLVFDIQGNTATNLNFYVTDSMHHFFRGALYFNRISQRDSIEPVYQFLRKDIDHMLKTFEWK
jgi:gliding motility-associated lipoprotein GldD